MLPLRTIFPSGWSTASIRVVKTPAPKVSRTIPPLPNSNPSSVPFGRSRAMTISPDCVVELVPYPATMIFPSGCTRTASGWSDGPTGLS